MVGVFLGANMSNRVLIKRGLSSNLNNAGVVAGELKYATDTNKLYIGTGTENIEIGGGSSRVIEIEYEDELPELSETLLGRIYYVRNTHKYYYVRGINGEYNFSAYYCKPNSQLETNISYEYQYVTPEDKVYKLNIDSTGYDFIKEATQDPGAKGRFADGTYIICTSSRKLFIADSTTESGYRELTNLTYSYYTRMNGSNAVAGNYFFCNSYNQIYYINSVSWNEFSEVIRAESRPNVEKRYAGKYYFVPNYIYYIYATTPEVLSWEQLKTDVDLRNLKTEIEYLLSGRLEVVEYSYQQPEACEEALGKLYMWKQYGEYKICVPGDTVVATIATVTQEESSGSTGSDDGGLDILMPIGGNYKQYIEGTYANRPEAGYGCNCYYATDQNKYYISMSTSGGYMTYYWAEVEMKMQSYKPTTDQTKGYYKVVSGNTTTIYQVVTYYHWVDLAQDQHPLVSCQKVSGQWGYDNFRFNRLQLEYTEKDLSSMESGYIYGVIEDA